MEEDIEKNIEKSIEEGIKKIVKQVIEEIVEKINIEEGIGDSPIFRYSGTDRKQIRKFLIYYRDFREIRIRDLDIRKGIKCRI
jgi:hypothetical protein